MILYAVSTIWIIVIGWVIFEIAGSTDDYQDEFDSQEISRFPCSDLATTSERSEEAQHFGKTISLAVMPDKKNTSDKFYLTEGCDECGSRTEVTPDLSNCERYTCSYFVTTKPQTKRLVNPYNDVSSMWGSRTFDEISKLKTQCLPEEYLRGKAN